MSPVAAGPVLAAAAVPVVGALSLALRTKANADALALPAGLPAHLPDKLAWNGSDLNQTSEHILKIDDTDHAEIRAASEYYKSLDQDGDLVEPSSFPLKTLGPKLRALSRDVHSGRGFCVIRGLDPASYSVEDLTLAYLGVQSYIAEQRGRQDKRGNMLVHIFADDSTKQMAEHHRHSTKAISFHNEEAGDVVGWLTRSTAAAGGKCIIASAYTVYNVLAATRPDVIRTLARADWPFSMPRFHCRPVIFYQDSKLIMNFGRAALMGSAAHPRPQHLPALTARQVEALDAIEAVAQATQLEIQTQAGDMHFINNLAVLHRREGFANGQGATEKRHLVRVRLRSAEHGWPIPRELAPEWDEAFKKQGVRQWHVEPMPHHFFPMRMHPN
ncbi:Clavaminate synthase-like protein [Parathielavia hyrcaniae]|uniref:Clavaminate synthase-like protein n=1 Tax=Parathielavia hyrcaniae TaxID=113614 RepID=A0AAN6PY50_9PEZI|nr:Clavaminate synthase-like protein [Parathielavia hyrcaniae]